MVEDFRTNLCDSEYGKGEGDPYKSEVEVSVFRISPNVLST
jgi:hypothetical protein